MDDKFKVVVILLCLCAPIAYTLAKAAYGKDEKEEVKEKDKKED